MDLLIKLMTARLFVLLLLVAVAVRLAVDFGHFPLLWYRQWRYPPQRGQSSLGLEMAQDYDKREAARVEARYRRVKAHLEQARRHGHDTKGLEAKARAALTLNNARYRREAVRTLIEVDMATPR